jgi:hypothetical protein
MKRLALTGVQDGGSPKHTMDMIYKTMYMLNYRKPERKLPCLPFLLNLLFCMRRLMSSATATLAASIERREPVFARQ